jgi:hypothetical protein
MAGCVGFRSRRAAAPPGGHVDDDPPTARGPAGLLRAASEEFFDRAAAFADAVRRAGSSAVGELPGPIPAAATELVHSMRTIVESVPAPTAPLDMLMEEIKAKRAIVRALQEQLASFETQLEVLERSLVPLHEWSRQWESAQNALLEPLRRKRD